MFAPYFGQKSRLDKEGKLKTMKSSHSTEYKGYRIHRHKTNVKGRSYDRYVVDLGTNVHGKRQRRSFSTEEKAKAAIREHLDRTKANTEAQNNLRKRIGEKAEQLGTDELLDAAMGLQLLKGTTTLTEAVRFYISHSRSPTDRRTVNSVITEYHAEAEADGLRPASLQDLKNRLNRFSNAFGERLIHQVGKVDVQEWSRSKYTAKQNGTQISALTRKHYLTVVGGLFNYALEQDYMAENPLTKKSRRRRKMNGIEDEAMPEIISVDAVESVMLAAQEHEPSMVPPLAIGFFCGVRTNELSQLDWSHISLEDKRITVPPSIAKKRFVRHIDIADNLAEWLAPYREESGLISPTGTTWRYRFDKVRSKANIEQWPHNAMRHCFATFYLMKTNDQNKTALQLGHRDTSLLFNHYRALATHEDAERFWNIRPEIQDNVINYSRNVG